MTISFSKPVLIATLLAASLTAVALLPAQSSAATAAARAAPPAIPALPTPPAPPADPADAADNGSAPGAVTSGTDSDTDDSGNWDSNRDEWRRWGNRRHFHQDSNDLVSVGHDATLPAGASSDSVVAVFGSATSDGTARQDVVSVFGDTTVNGPASGSAVAVLGNVSINAEIGQDVVAVLGNVTLGPNAHVHGHVVSVLGTVNQDPAAVVEHGVERVMPGNFASAEGLRTWIGHGLMFGRPLVIGTGLQWLWGLSFAFLAVYTILEIGRAHV